MIRPTKHNARWCCGIFVIMLTWTGSITFAQDGDTAKKDGTGTKTVVTPKAPDKKAENQIKPRRTLDLSNPRATMQTFLLAMQDAAGERPERINDAIQCLNLSELEGDGADKSERAQRLATRLYTIVDKAGVRLDDIPEKPETLTHTVYSFEAGDKGIAGAQIVLAIDPVSSAWLFTPQTLSSIASFEQSVANTAKPEEATESDVPTARRSARAAMGGFLKAMNATPQDTETALYFLDPTGRDVEVWNVRGKEIAIKLKNVLDKIKEVVLLNIPDDPAGDTYVWYQSSDGVSRIALSRIAEASSLPKDWRYTPLKGEWRITPQTLDAVDEMYSEFEGQQIVQTLRDAGVEESLSLTMRLERIMPPRLREDFLGLTLWKWCALFLFIPLGWLIQLIAASIAAIVLRNWLQRQGLLLEATARRLTARSIGAVLTVLVWFYAIRFLALPEQLLGVLTRGLKLALGLTTVWVGYRVVDIIGGKIASTQAVHLTRFDDVLIPMLRKILRVLVVVVTLIFVLQWMGQELTTLLGALGVGGVALAFAAQDTIGNFFGSITVLFDRPFGIGDWIVMGEVEGTVERVGFRSTRVRTFYNSVITVPNAKMINMSVDNYGARRFRRVRIMLSLTYSTPPEKIDAFCEGIRELLRLHPYTRKDYYQVYFNQFAASSLDVLLYAFFDVPDWSTELRERHNLFLDIMRLAKRLGVEFAYPTTTVWMQRAGRGDGAGAEEIERFPADPHAVGVTYAAELFEKMYGKPTNKPGPVVIESSPRSQRSSNDSST